MLEGKYQMISAAITAGVGFAVAATAMNKIFSSKEQNNDRKVPWTEIAKIGVGSALTHTGVEMLRHRGR